VSRTRQAHNDASALKRWAPRQQDKHGQHSDNQGSITDNTERHRTKPTEQLEPSSLPGSGDGWLVPQTRKPPSRILIRLILDEQVAEITCSPMTVSGEKLGEADRLGEAKRAPLATLLVEGWPGG